MKKIFLFSILLILVISCSAQLSEERLTLKNYAFCKCLQNVYEGDSIFILDGSSSGYFQIGAYNINVYDSIDSIAKIFSLKEYKSYGNHPLGIMKCLDFYNSKQLELFVKSFDNSINK